MSASHNVACGFWHTSVGKGAGAHVLPCQPLHAKLFARCFCAGVQGHALIGCNGGAFAVQPGRDIRGQKLFVKMKLALTEKKGMQSLG